MYSISLPTRPNRVLRRISALAVIGVAATTLAAAPAQAQPVNGTGAAKGCPVEDEHGNVTYVPVGTRIGLFHCGSDGEWHFGWLTTALVRSPSGPRTPGGIASAATLARGVRQ